MKWVLHYARMREGEERVAISIDDPIEGPFLVVERNGFFVTCLGRGMKHDLRVITREELDVHAGHIRLARERRELARARVASGKAENDMITLSQDPPRGAVARGDGSDSAGSSRASPACF